MYKIKILLTAAAFILSMFAAQAQTPGGVGNPANYTWQVWLTPDNYNYSTGVWTNKITGTGTVGNFSAPVNKPALLPTGGYNFHPSVEFTKSSNADASKRLITSGNVVITGGDNVTSIFVYKRANNTQYDFLFSFNNGDSNGDLSFRSTGDDILTLHWPGTSRSPVLSSSEGIVTVDNANNATNQVFGYVNGAASPGIATASASFNSPWALGANGSAGGYGFEGIIQEVIILKAGGTNNHIASADLQKIHSYLAIKYGITLNNNNNYINSASTVVWDRALNTGYNNNIFGIGRDDAAGLNQVQSVSQNSNMLTIFKGSLGKNNNNASPELGDKNFLLLGSNGLTGNTDYEFPAGRAFANASIIDKINYHSTAVYRAQVTSGSSNSQTVNVNVSSTSALYILVSSDPAFPTASTRIYKINALTAKDVLIYDKDYVSIAGYQAIPGSSQDVTFGLWLTPDSYSNGVWTNLFTGAVGDFTQPANWTSKTPPNVTVGANFQKAVQFRPGSATIALNRLQSTNGVNLNTTDAFTFLIVYKATNAGYTYQNIMNFQGSTSGGASYNGSAYTLSYADTYTGTSKDRLTMGWPTTARALGSAPFGATALITVDNSNGQVTTNGIRYYLNGTQVATAASASGSVNNQMALGAAWYDLTGNGERGVNADIQEVIMLKRPKTTYPFLADVNAGADLMKIQTYLALKYGITLNSNYMATDGTIVWNAAANTGYNKLIIGLGRDDETSLNQRQSVSSAYNGTTIYLGNKLQELNSQNTERLNDMEYLILGSNGLTTISPVTIANGETYANGSINVGTGLNFQSDIIYKAQLTNLTEKTISMKLKMDGYLYVLVSKSDTFDPLTTNIYPVNSKLEASVTVDAEYKYIRFVGYEAGPGGVNIDLKLWLRADAEGALETENLPTGQTGDYLSGYNYPVVNNEAPAVKTWTDQLRRQIYQWPASPSTSSWRTPVYEPDNLMMNFHPSVRFWGSGTTYGSWLTNSKGIFATGGITDKGHTAYFITANDFSTGNRWVYPMTFGANYTTIPMPGYGMERQSGTGTNIYGRFRTGSGPITGNLNLFTIGATSICGFYQAGLNFFYRFNGFEDNTGGDFTSTSGNANNFNLSIPSYLGSGYGEDRTVIGVIGEVIFYERALNVDDQRKVESYLAIKYGVTLRPSNTGTKRFIYLLSNNRVFWSGDVDPTEPVRGKYAVFYNNVAAVVRDDAAKLNNEQSHSTDNGSILHMGVAGNKLGNNFEVAVLPNDLEVISWGANSQEGITPIPYPEPCSDFDHIFNKKWLVHKQTKDDRPIAMLIGAEDNSHNNLGSTVSPGISDMYAALGSGNDVSMIVADSPDKLDPSNPAYGDFIAVIPMRYIDGEQQCIYTLTDSIYYITFGYKPNTRGCYGNIQFDDVKTYDWNTQWTRTNYSLNGVGVKTITKDQVDLGDSVLVTTQITYDNTLRASTYYPRFSSNPRNGIEIQRRYGTQGLSKVTTTITFSTPVIPEFFISGLDSRSSLWDQVVITASCPSGSAIPTLMYATTPKKSTYVIQGNRATVNKTRTASASSPNGRVNVTFSAGVTTLTIEYYIRSRRTIRSSAQSIFISPISISSPLPPPVITEDNLSFTKQAKTRYITTCETMEYTFRIGNYNAENKYVDFKDVLPDKMNWVAETISLDTINANNPSIKFNDYGKTKTLTIDSLLVPCGTEILFKAIAYMDADAETDTYFNKADIYYEQMINNHLQSSDAQSHDSLTYFNASWAERLDTVLLTATVEPPKYTDNGEMIITLKVNNPNLIDITDMFLDLSWSETEADAASDGAGGFRYISGTWNNAAGSAVSTADSYPTGLSICGLTDGGLADGSVGFTLPNGETVFTFKLKAPDKSYLEYEYDDLTGLPTTQRAPLVITFDFSSTTNDPCIIRSIDELSGALQVPYKTGRTFIIVNENVTTRLIQ